MNKQISEKWIRIDTKSNNELMVENDSSIFQRKNENGWNFEENRRLKTMANIKHRQRSI
jgi:hypothetical protein